MMALWIISVFVGLALAVWLGSHLRRTSTAEAVPPAWSEFLSRQEYEVFQSYVERAANAENLTAYFANGMLLTRVSSAIEVQIPLISLLQPCLDRPMSQWDELLRRELHHAAIPPESALPDLADFEQCKLLLAVQFSIESQLDKANLVYREDLPGVLTHLVLDLPGGIRTISPSEIATWNRPTEELFALALAQAHAHCHVETELIELDYGLRATLITCENPFVATLALLLKDYPDTVGPLGAIVAVPTQNILISYPIRDSAPEALLPLAWTAAKRFNEGPRSITPQLFWYFKGRFQTLPYELNGRVFRCDPPEELADLLSMG